MAVLKYSRQRESIMACLRSRCDHPTADMIYMDVRKTYPKISLGTVYRNLSLLVDQGEIKRISCGEDWDRYDARISPHYHFRCRQCGSVTDLELAPMAHIDVLAGSGFDGDIEGHFAFFYGICGKCKQMEADNNKKIQKSVDKDV